MNFCVLILSSNVFDSFIFNFIEDLCNSSYAFVQWVLLVQTRITFSTNPECSMKFSGTVIDVPTCLYSLYFKAAHQILYVVLCWTVCHAQLWIDWTLMKILLISMKYARNWNKRIRYPIRLISFIIYTQHG